MSYVIGSFNLNRLDYTSTDKRAIDFKKLAEIIRQEKFDVIAFQEIKSPRAFEEDLCKRIEFDYCVLPSEGKKYHSYAEYYGFAWNRKKFRQIEAESSSQIFLERGTSQKMVRPPLVLRLTPQGLPGGLFFELRLIDVHLAFTNPDPIRYPGSDVNYRKQELDVLAKDVFYSVEKKRYGNSMPSYTIVMGDYNLCLAEGPKLSEVIPIGKNDGFLTIQEDKTSLKQVKGASSENSDAEDQEVEESQGEYDFYSKNYDHFSFSKSLDERAYITGVRRVDALKYCNNDLAEYRKTVSDHVPIRMEFSLRK